ncbi:MAG: tRNA uridine-5-carboxymethylaminomethyl(34) synthesis GTPase MnmE [bacterium]|nr:tRNA uridine-5-carboxymethylaminomethyl(34) synthesis GTPase MnmE [bacterium]
MDTIAAIATPIGEGGIGIVRASGPDAIKIADHIFKGKIKPLLAKTHTIHYGKIIEPDTKKELDEVLLMVMKKPHTYTREDMIEINAHGGITVLKNILDLLLRSGARLAEPGEFTKRAFLNGRIDLVQAEAVLDIVRGRTDKSIEVALSQLDGKLSTQIKEIKDKLIEIETALELSIDFPEENIGKLNPEKLKRIAYEVNYEIVKLIESGKSGKLVRNGAVFPIVGRTNVGKSSIFNALLSKDKAIVTPYPGTTRDTIEDYITVDGIPIKLVDTAGWRDTSNPIEQEGVLRTRKAINEAFGILFVFDKSDGILKEDFELLTYIKGKKIIGLLNKCDLTPAKYSQNFEFPLISVSALRGDNIDLIPTAISKLVSRANESPLITRERHLDILRRANIRVEKAQKGMDDNLAHELISYEIKEAINILSEITGEITSEDILNRIFSEFCIGK